MTAVGSVDCPECGLEAAAVTAPTLLGKARGWLVDGYVSPATRRCANGHEWSLRTSLTLVRAEGWRRMSARSGVPWWRVPYQLLRVLHGRRNADPVPLTYLIAIFVGAGLGVLLDWWLGWPWWAVMVGFLAFVWLVFLSSSFFGSGRADLFADLVGVVDPDRAEAMRARTLAKLAGQAPFTIYGLPESWTGPRSFGGHGRAGTLRHLALAHGEPEERPFVVVDSNRADRDWIVDQTKQNLGRSLFFRHLESPRFDSPEEMNEWLEHQDREFDDWFETPWQEISISVDGAARRFEFRAEGEDWIAVGFLDGAAIVGLDVGGLRLDQVSLAKIRDFTIYVEGSIEQERRRRRP